MKKVLFLIPLALIAACTPQQRQQDMEQAMRRAIRTCEDMGFRRGTQQNQSCANTMFEQTMANNRSRSSIAAIGMMNASNNINRNAWGNQNQSPSYVTGIGGLKRNRFD
jgi:predicted lipoprotein